MRSPSAPGDCPLLPHTLALGQQRPLHSLYSCLHACHYTFSGQEQQVLLLLSLHLSFGSCSSCWNPVGEKPPDGEPSQPAVPWCPRLTPWEGPGLCRFFKSLIHLPHSTCYQEPLCLSCGFACPFPPTTLPFARHSWCSQIESLEGYSKSTDGRTQCPAIELLFYSWKMAKRFLEYSIMLPHLQHICFPLVCDFQQHVCLRTRS